MYRLKGQKYHFPLNSLLVPTKDGENTKKNNYSIIQNSNRQNIFFFWLPLGGLDWWVFLVLWLVIISNRTSLWFYVNRVAFFKWGELQPQASLGGGVAQHKAGAAPCCRDLGSPTAPSYSRCCYSLTKPRPGTPDFFPSSIVCSLGRDPFLNKKPVHLLI